MTLKGGAPMLMTHGMGGLDGATLEFAKELGEKGWKVYLPLLDGKFNTFKPLHHAALMRKSGRWVTNSATSTGPVLNDMSLLADWISRRHGGQRVVVVGHCLTGGFPLALLSRPSVKTAVLCQPALPLKRPILPQSKAKREAFGLSEAEMDASLQALARDSSKRLYGFHYLEDPLAPMDKFDRLHAELVSRNLGHRFRPVVLESLNSRRHESWWDKMPTAEKRQLLKPHVTLTGSDLADRRRLRDRFDRLVQP